MIRTDVVVELRDLHGRHEPREWRVTGFGAPYYDYQRHYVTALLEAAAVVLQWRAGAGLPPESHPDYQSELEHATNFARRIAAVVGDANAPLPSLSGADCTLVARVAAQP